MNRINKKFKELKKQNKKAFIVYITGGYPNLTATEKLVPELERSGVDVVEIGIPFSDPIADGPVIQKASEAALGKGATLRKILQSVENIRKKSDIPIVFMSYFNPIYRYGVEKFVKDALKCGVDGAIIPDLPAEEAEEIIKIANRNKFCMIFLASPTSTLSRLRAIARKSEGFIYYVSLTGVTGIRKSLAGDIAANIRKIKRLTDKPVCVGFGVSDEKQAKEISRIADGVIVGSAIIKSIEKFSKKRNLEKNVGRFTARLAKAVHGE
ncbi:MAG: tryptophan synthase subunit alpha [Candidatus Omnitrophota bacterium]|nr:tryptophan synthase subunit alpha [Candidatus Omnitrophota bacterium]